MDPKLNQRRSLSSGGGGEGLGVAVGATAAELPSVRWSSPQRNEGRFTRKAVQGTVSMKNTELNKSNTLRHCRTAESLRRAHAHCASNGLRPSAVPDGPGRPSLQRGQVSEWTPPDPTKGLGCTWACGGLLMRVG